MIRWWCSAAGTPWTWAWQPYPGVWLFIALLAGVWFVVTRRAGPAASAPRAPLYFAGVALLWLALDWPLGALAGYLASAHMAQFLLIAFAAPPLLLLALPAGQQDRQPSRLSRALTHPLTALVAFNAAVVATHLPVATDTLMPMQTGSLLIDLVWLGAGLLFWWPVIRPAHAWFSPPVRMAYLFANMVFMTAPGAMITFSELPIYATYELAPPIPGFSPLDDQRIAGLNMRLGAAIVSWTAISLLFLRWNRDEVRLMEEEAAAAGIRATDGQQAVTPSDPAAS